MCLGAFGQPGTDADGGPTCDRSVHRVRPADEGVPSARRSDDMARPDGPARAVEAQPDVRVRAQQRQRRSVGDRRRHLEARRPGQVDERLRARSARHAARADLVDHRRLPAGDREPRLVRSDAGRSVGAAREHVRRPVQQRDRRRLGPVRQRPAAHHAPPRRRDVAAGRALRGCVPAAQHGGTRRNARTSVRPTAPHRPTRGARSSRSRRAIWSRWSICRRATSSPRRR